jgi:hypothetical protein
METAHVDQNSFWHKMMPDLEVNRYGVISIVLLIVGCMGGLTVGLGAIDQTWQLIAVVIPTMLTLSLLLAVAPMKQIMNSMLIAVVIDVVIMLLNFFS